MMDKAKVAGGSFGPGTANRVTLGGIRFAPASEDEFGQFAVMLDAGVEEGGVDVVAVPDRDAEAGLAVGVVARGEC